MIKFNLGVTVKEKIVMAKRISIPSYIKIAVDIAYRISIGEFHEGERISGRSTLVSIYNVSPETIRRAVALLKDTEVVEVTEKSGIIIKSKEKAKEFLGKFKTKSDFNNLKVDTFNLIKERSLIDSKIEENIERLIEYSSNTRSNGFIATFESKVESGSIIVGNSIGEINFWHNTKATIVGIKRGEEIFLSPGPYFVIKEEDIIVYVGSDEVLGTVEKYIKSSK